ncbi:MAG: ABC transporter substrate-binding protein [Promethearchaeota archaeon]
MSVSTGDTNRCRTSDNSYWGFPGYFEVVLLRIIENETARMVAGLAGQFHYIENVTLTYLATYIGDPSFHVEQSGESIRYFFFEIYCGPLNVNGTNLRPGNPQFQRNNATLRRALALGINYSQLIYEIYGDHLQLNSGVTGVSRSIPGHNSSVVQACDYNYSVGIQMARDLMKIYNPIASGWESNYPGANEVNWTTADLLGRNIDLNRYFGNPINERINQILASNWALIGIKTHETIREWDTYCLCGLDNPNPYELDVIYRAWIPETLNPYYIFDRLFNLESMYSYSRINDSNLTSMIESARETTDKSIELDIYKDIQSYVYDVDRPLNPSSNVHFSIWTNIVYQVHKEELKGVHHNILGILDVWNWYYE